MRRRPRFGFFFVGIFLLPLIGVGIFNILIPIIFALIIAFVVYKLAKLFFEQNEKESSNRKTTNNYRNDSVHYNEPKFEPETMLNKNDIKKIDETLTNFFKDNMVLSINEDIGLTTNSGQYKSLDELVLVYKDEKVIKFSEFKKNNRSIANKILELLLAFGTKGYKVKTDEKETKKQETTKVDYIELINKLNSEIPQEEITNGLYQTCDLLKQIELLKETKSDKDKVRKINDYYLPILVDILKDYKKLQDSKIHGEEFKKCEHQLIKTITLINEALKTICSNMQEDDYMSLNADINTLQSLLKKDGYGNNPFKGEKN